VSLNKSIIAVFHALDVTAQALNVQIEVFNLLVSHSHTLIQILVLNDNAVLLSEKSLLKLNGLRILASELLNLVIEGGNSLLNLVSISEGGIKLAIGFFNSKNFLVNSFVQSANSVSKLTLLAIEYLKTEFLVLNFLLSGSKVTFKLENSILLLLLNIVIVSYFLVKPIDVSPQ
jgi:hypothetical protein